MQNLKLLDYTKKRLDGMYLVIYAIKNNINIKKAEVIENVDVYTLVGVNRKGLRDLIGIYQDRPLNNRYWLDIFESLKSRGLNEVLFLAVDDNKNLKRTAKIAFPMINFVDSLTFIISKFDKYTSEKSARKVASRLYKLYSQEINERYSELRKSGIFTVDNCKTLFEKWVTMIGYDNYKKEFKAYPETHSYRKSNVSKDKCINNNEKSSTKIIMAMYFHLLVIYKKMWK